MKRPKPQLEPLNVTDEERRTLESWVRRRKSVQDTKDMALRAQIVLASTRPGDDGLPVSPHTVADRLGIPFETASKWRSRFVEAGLNGLTGPDVPYVPDVPAEETAQRSNRNAPPTPAAEPLDTDGAYDIVGLFLAPPERAVALCVAEEETQTQQAAAALRTALEATTGRTTGSLHRRHRAVEFRRFLAMVDKEVPADVQVHLLCDNQAAHRAPTVKNWLLAHPRFRIHATPTGASWPELVARWSGSVPALEQEIRTWADTAAGTEPEPGPGSEPGSDSEPAEPYVWTKR